MDNYYARTGSWSHWDAVRHYMYEDIYDCLFRVNYPEAVNYFEVGIRNTDSPIGRMMMQLQETKGFGLNMTVGDLPEYNILDLNLRDESQSVVVADQVLEHVTRVWEAAEELMRVTCKNGLLIVASPFIFPMHYCPKDCWRISPQGYEVLFPPNKVEMLTLKTWGSREVVSWANNHPDLRGFYGDFIDVGTAKAEMPMFDKPYYNTDHPIVVWMVGRKL